MVHNEQNDEVCDARKDPGSTVAGYIKREESGLARNRTWIWSFGNSYTIHCTTRPVIKRENREM